MNKRKQTYLTRFSKSHMEYREIYCNNCKKVLGRYNVKFYSDAKIAELLKDSHAVHVRQGHQLDIRKVKD